MEVVQKTWTLVADRAASLSKARNITNVHLAQI